jgi:hypothetical protein
MGGASFLIANTATASTPRLLPEGCNQVALYNTSTTAIAYVRVQPLSRSTDTMPEAVVPTTGDPAVGDIPVPPGAQIRITCGWNWKSISAIASAEDGNLVVTPGYGF